MALPYTSGLFGLLNIFNRGGVGGPGTPVQVTGPLTLTFADHNAANLIVPTTRLLTINDGIGVGFGVSIKGAFTYSGSAVVTDQRTSGGSATTSYSTLLQTGYIGQVVNGSALTHDTYDLVGQKV